MRRSTGRCADAPDLILMDLNMPVKGGVDALARSQGRTQDRPHPGGHRHHARGAGFGRAVPLARLRRFRHQADRERNPVVDGETDPRAGRVSPE